MTRNRRTVSVGSLSIMVIFAGAHGIPALRQWQKDAQSSAAELIGEAARAQESLLRLDATLDSLEHRRDRFLEMAELLVGGGTLAAAGGSLASHVSAAANTAHVQVDALQVHVDTAHASVFARVAVRAQVSGDIRGITRLLAELEREVPLLVVREWSIAQSDPAAPATQPEALRMELLVQGLALNRSPGGDVERSP